MQRPSNPEVIPPRTLTREQRRAVTREGRDLCVVAGAGSGKTLVLVERIVRLVHREGDPHDLSSILAITFTRKAAREMKERLAARFAALGRWDLRAQVEWAHVSTIHAFCARLLRENAVAAAVDPAFEMMDEARQAATLREALSETTDRWRTARASDLDAISRLGVVDLDEAVLHVYADLRGAGVSPQAVRTGGADAGTLREALEKILGRLRRLAPLIPLVTPGAATRAQRALAHEEEVAALSGGGADPSRTLRALAALDGGINLQCRGPVREVLGEIRDPLIPGAKMAAADVLVGPSLRALRELLIDLDDRFAAHKRDRGVLDFSDLELLTLRLLEERPAVREAVAGRFTQILVDEAQDVNPVQASIIDAVRSEGRYFAVGDVKQSIYGFRHARPSLFHAYSEEVGEEGRVTLSSSFRSTPGLIEFTNHCFGRLFGSQPLVEWNDMVAAGPADAGSGGEVEIFLVEGDRVQDVRRAEAAALGERILEVVGRGEFSFCDIAVLLRALTHVKFLERAFEERGIPYYVVKGRGFFEAREIVDLVRMLECVRNPRDEVSLSCTLRSPFCGMTEDGLLALANARSGLPEGRLADLLRPGRAEGVPGLSAADRDRWLEFVRLLEDLRVLAARGTVREVIEEALERSGYADAVWLLPGARRRAANLRKALELAESLGGTGDLTGFLAHLRDFRQREVRETEAPTGGEREDVVRLLTVHASKGLEFPMVILPDLSRRPARISSGILTEEGDITSRLVPGPGEPSLSTSRYEALEVRRERREEEEGLRLLYVAMTRAERRLLLSARATRTPRGSWWSSLSGVLDIGEAEVAFGGSGRRAGLRRVEEPGGRGAPSVSPLAGYAAEIGEGRPIPDVPENLRRWAERRRERVERRLPEFDGSAYQNTVSELVLYASCPRCHVERYRLRLPRGADRGIDREHELEREDAGLEDAGLDELPPTDRGMAVHDVLRAYDPLGSSGVEEIARPRLRRFPGGEALLRDIVEMVEGFYASEIGGEVVRAAPSRVRREVPFLARWEVEDGSDLLLRGQIDLLYPRPDGSLRIVDYKTGRAAPDAYGIQLVAYAMALEKFQGEPVADAWLVYLNPGEEPRGVSVALTTEARRRMGEVAREFARFAARGGVVPASHAGGCPRGRDQR